MIYKLYESNGIQGAFGTTDDNRFVCFLFDDYNPDYQEYLKWLAEGNTPEPADE